MNYLKHIAAIFAGVISTVVVGAITTHLVLSDMPIQSAFGATIILGTIGSFVIIGVGVALGIGREICERILGWFF